jgi:hypothetical protein
MQQQFDALRDLLYDTSPVVRSTGFPLLMAVLKPAAAEGVCRIAFGYWELIPHVRCSPPVLTAQATITSFLTTLVSDLAHDAASVTVRVAVLKGLAYLLDNPLSQARGCRCDCESYTHMNSN